MPHCLQHHNSNLKHYHIFLLDYHNSLPASVLVSSLAHLWSDLHSVISDSFKILDVLKHYIELKTLYVLPVSLRVKAKALYNILFSPLCK